MSGLLVDRMTLWQDDRMTGPQDDNDRMIWWRDDWMTGFLDDRMIGWQDDRMILWQGPGWPDDQMTKWPNDQRPNDQMTKWPNDRMTGCQDEWMTRIADDWPYGIFCCKLKCSLLAIPLRGQRHLGSTLPDCWFKLLIFWCMHNYLHKYIGKYVEKNQKEY